MRRLIGLLLLIHILPSCRTTTTTVKETNQTSIEGTKLKDFVNFLNIKRGDTLEKALQSFGTPTLSYERQKKDAFITNIYKDEKDTVMLSYAYYKNNKTLNHVRVSGNPETNFASTKAFLRSKEFNDAKINFLGTHIDTIQKVLGKPRRVRNQYYYYHSGPTSIAFKCDKKENRCIEMYFFWWLVYK